MNWYYGVHGTQMLVMALSGLLLVAGAAAFAFRALRRDDDAEGTRDLRPCSVAVRVGEGQDRRRDG
ncbi:hypothetical protein [Saccharothrix obliqua]|uniref:hypothetical protein n=1 Tax=Saccharothrix obliqua TaxID=2861747 RepID=UPI001C5CF1D0|nr:hypothetical protein [Saccharothrix obliqua]MBW4718418.1 hypothetical protein [Saccharothrix obliqua]